MSIRPGGAGTPSRAEQLIVRSIAGLVLVAVVLLLGGIIVAAVLRSQARAIETLEARISVLESNRSEAPPQHEQTSQPAQTDNRSSVPERQQTQRNRAEPSDERRELSERSRRVTKRPAETNTPQQDTEREIISALRKVVQADTFGQLSLADTEAGAELLKRIEQAADREALGPRVLARGAILALLLDELELSQTLLNKAEAGNAPTATFYETLARQRLAKGQTDAVIVAARRMAEQTNNSPTALVLLATAQRLRDETGPLAGTLAFGRSWNGLTPPDQLLLARAWAEAGAIEKLNASLAALPADLPEELRSELDELLAIAQVLSDDADDALPTFETLDEATGVNPERALWTGRALLKLGQRSEARTAFITAADLAPYRAGGHYWLGQMAMTDRDNEAADEHLQRAVAVAPQYAQAWEAWGTLALNAGELEPAFERLTNAIEAAPHLAQPHFIMAIALAKSERKEETAEALRRAITRDPSLAENARLSKLFRDMFRDELEAILSVPPPATSS